jgi:hypothetical protein
MDLNFFNKFIIFLIGNDGIVFFPSFPVVAPYHSQPLFTNPLDWIYYGTFNALGFPGTLFNLL